MKLLVYPRNDKPQGFENGRLAKMGIYACMYDCGAYFSTLDEAKYHTPCAKRDETDRVCEEMRELARKNRAEEPLWSEEEEGEVDNNPEVEEKQAAVADKKKQSVFDKLPVQDPEDRVAWFVATSDFIPKWE